MSAVLGKRSPLVKMFLQYQVLLANSSHLILLRANMTAFHGLKAVYLFLNDILCTTPNMNNTVNT